MKKTYPLFLLLLGFVAYNSACKKELAKEKIYTPEKNKWIVNVDTFGTADFKYYDTANVIFGQVAGKGSVLIHFMEKPKASGDFVFRATADEPHEISITIADSIKNTVYQSMDNDNRPLKELQFAQVNVDGGKIKVAFNQKWLKTINSEQQVMVSLNIE